MKATLTKGYMCETVDCETVSIKINNVDVYATKEKVDVFLNGFIVSSLMVVDAKNNPNVLNFKHETPRYKPKTAKKIYVPPVQVYFNALADNFINFWRGLLK